MPTLISSCELTLLNSLNCTYVQRAQLKFFHQDPVSAGSTVGKLRNIRRETSVQEVNLKLECVSLGCKTNYQLCLTRKQSYFLGTASFFPSHPSTLLASYLTLSSSALFRAASRCRTFKMVSCSSSVRKLKSIILEHSVHKRTIGTNVA